MGFLNYNFNFFYNIKLLLTYIKYYLNFINIFKTIFILMNIIRKFDIPILYFNNFFLFTCINIMIKKYCLNQLEVLSYKINKNIL